MAEVFKGAGTEIAEIVGRHAVMDQAAEKIRAKATANASQHRNTGAFSNNFKVEKVPAKKGGVQDRMVVNDHRAALDVELGHFAYRADGAPGEWVAGQFNLIRAVRG